MAHYIVFVKERKSYYVLLQEHSWKSHSHNVTVYNNTTIWYIETFEDTYLVLYVVV